jgi:anti-sigma factor RsiW
MNPDKLFNYLDGKLSPTEREAFEDQLVRDPELQREFAIARRIHDRTSGEVREVLLDEPPSGADRSRQMVRRITIVFLTLIFINTLVGVIAIGLLESKRRNARTATEQNRQDIARALQQAAANALPTPSLNVGEIKITVPPKQQDATVEKINAAAQQTGGSAVRNLSNENGTLVFAEIPAARLSEFRQALTALGAALPEPASPGPASGNAILQIRIVERTE